MLITSAASFISTVWSNFFFYKHSNAKLALNFNRLIIKYQYLLILQVKVPTWVNDMEIDGYVGVGARFGPTLESKEKRANHTRVVLADPPDYCSPPKKNVILGPTLFSVIWYTTSCQHLKSDFSKRKLEKRSFILWFIIRSHLSLVAFRGDCPRAPRTVQFHDKGKYCWKCQGFSHSYHKQSNGYLHLLFLFINHLNYFSPKYRHCLVSPTTSHTIFGHTHLEQ